MSCVESYGSSDSLMKIKAAGSLETENNAPSNTCHLSLKMKIHPFVEAVASLQFEDCFNPYSDRCEVHDRRDAPRRRAAALSAMLRRATEEPVDAIWIGRDLGYRGGRRTG